MSAAKVLAFLVLVVPTSLALAGANRDRGQDEVGPGPDEGPSYFGVVLDAAGKPVDDARVTATHRDGLAMVTRSNAAGGYKLPGFNKRFNPDDVKISCAKSVTNASTSRDETDALSVQRSPLRHR